MKVLIPLKNNMDGWKINDNPFSTEDFILYDGEKDHISDFSCFETQMKHKTKNLIDTIKLEGIHAIVTGSSRYMELDKMEQVGITVLEAANPRLEETLDDLRLGKLKKAVAVGL